MNNLIIKSIYRKIAEDLLTELNNSHTMISYIDAPRQKFSGHKIRRIESLNPEWYREIYTVISGNYEYKKEKKRKCGITTYWSGSGSIRKRVVNALIRISAGQRKFYKCDVLLYELIGSYIIEGYNVMGYHVEPFRKNINESEIS